MRAIVLVCFSFMACTPGNASLALDGGVSQFFVTTGREFAFVRDESGIGMWQLSATLDADGKRHVFRAPLDRADAPRRVAAVSGSVTRVFAAGARDFVTADSADLAVVYELHDAAGTRPVLRNCQAPVPFLGVGMAGSKRVIIGPSGCSQSCAGTTAVFCPSDGTACTARCLAVSATGLTAFPTSLNSNLVVVSDTKVRLGRLRDADPPVAFRELPLAGNGAVAASASPDGKHLVTLRGLDPFIVNAFDVDDEGVPSAPRGVTFPGTRVDSVWAFDEGFVLVGQALDAEPVIVLAMYHWASDVPVASTRYAFDVNSGRQPVTDGKNVWLTYVGRRPSPSDEQGVDLYVRHLGAW